MEYKIKDIYELNNSVLEGKIDENDRLEFNYKEGAEIVIFVNHRKKVLTVRRGNDENKKRKNGDYIEIVGYDGLPQPPSIVTFRDGSLEYGAYNELLLKNGF